MDGYWTPRILYVSREFWKPGHDAQLNRIEAEGARVCIGLGVPRPYLGIESLTGSKEVWYLNGFASAGQLAKVRSKEEQTGLSWRRPGQGSESPGRSGQDEAAGKGAAGRSPVGG